MRVDKWLWTARLFKTSALAAGAVKGGRVHVGGVGVKPSREVGPGQELGGFNRAIPETNARARPVIRRGP